MGRDSYVAVRIRERGFGGQSLTTGNALPLNPFVAGKPLSAAASPV